MRGSLYRRTYQGMDSCTRRFDRKHYVGWAVAPIMVLALSGCGGGNDKTSTRALTLQQPERPTAAQCDYGSASAAKPTESPPRAGTYEFKTTGKKVLIGEKRRVFKLPTSSKAVITPARRVGNILCFTTQRKYESDLGDTATFLIRGSDIYLRKLRFQSGGYIKSLSPNPPLLSLSGTELDWSGVFRGRTSGQYAAEVVGRKRIKVGPRKVRAVGIKTRVSYGGDIKGWERSTRWIAVERNMVIAEDVVQERKFGLDRLRLSYRASLESLEPSQE